MNINNNLQVWRCYLGLLSYVIPIACMKQYRNMDSKTTAGTGRTGSTGKSLSSRNRSSASRSSSSTASRTDDTDPTLSSMETATTLVDEVNEEDTKRSDSDKEDGDDPFKPAPSGRDNHGDEDDDRMFNADSESEEEGVGGGISF